MDLSVVIALAKFTAIKSKEWWAMVLDFDAARRLRIKNSIWYGAEELLFCFWIAKQTLKAQLLDHKEYCRCYNHEMFV